VCKRDRSWVNDILALLGATCGFAKHLAISYTADRGVSALRQCFRHPPAPGGWARIRVCPPTRNYNAPSVGACLPRYQGPQFLASVCTIPLEVRRMMRTIVRALAGNQPLNPSARRVRPQRLARERPANQQAAEPWTGSYTRQSGRPLLDNPNRNTSPRTGHS